MTTTMLESLGFTKEELQEKLLDRLCADVLQGISYDEDGDPFSDESDFGRKLKERVKQHIDENIAAVAEKHVLPNVSKYIDNLTLQERTKWGEKVGTELSFVEYLVQRAETYLTEQVSWDGKSKSEDSYNFRGAQSRLTYLVNKHLHFEIERAMKDALNIAQGSIAKAIETTVRLKMEELVTAFKITTEMKEKR